MSIDVDHIVSTAHLARLGLDPDALEPLARELSQVLTLVEQLQAIDTDGIEPMAHPSSAGLYLRDDVATETDQRELLQSPAPDVKDGYFLVPRVIE